MAMAMAMAMATRGRVKCVDVVPPSRETNPKEFDMDNTPLFLPSIDECVSSIRFVGSQTLVQCSVQVCYILDYNPRDN